MPDASVVVRVLSPLLKEIYKSAKQSLRLKMSGWKAGGDEDQLRRYHHKLSSVKTLWSRGQPVFIEDFYYPSRVEVRTLHRRRFSTSTLKSAPARAVRDLPEGCVVVEGIVGQGKSIFMRHLALSMLGNESTDRLPLFLELRNITEKLDLEDLATQTLSALGAAPDRDVFWHLVKQGKLVLLLDGFDEIEDKFVNPSLSFLADLLMTNPRLNIIVSSRPRNAIQSAPDFQVVRLCPLRTSDHLSFLQGLGVPLIRAHEIVDAITQSPPDIREAISTPLMMSIVVLIYESVNKIPPYLAEFFSALFHVVFTQHDSFKQAFQRKHHTGLSEGQLQRLFEGFCFVVMHKSYGRTLSRARFDECFTIALRQSGDQTCSVDSFRADIINVACLMLEEGVGDATFLHKGILDFFASAFVLRFNDNSAEGFYKAAARDYSKWKGALQFLEKTDPRRYLEYYYLVAVAEDVEALSELLLHGDEDEFIEAMSSLLNPTNIVMHESMLRIEFKHGSRSEIWDIVGGACIERLENDDLFEGSVSGVREKALEHYGLPIDYDEETKAVTVSIGSAVRLVGWEVIRNALIELEYDLVEDVKKANEALDEFERRSELIDFSLLH